MAPSSAPPPRAKGPTKLTSDRARELGRKGGQAKAACRKLAEGIGLLDLLEKDSSFRPFVDVAEAWRAQAMRDLTARFGAVDLFTSTMVATAALQLAGSRWGFTYAAGRFAANPFDPTSHEYVSGDAQEFVRASKLAKDANDSIAAAWQRCLDLEAAKPPEAPEKGVPSLEEALV